MLAHLLRQVAPDADLRPLPRPAEPRYRPYRMCLALPVFALLLLSGSWSRCCSPTGLTATVAELLTTSLGRDPRLGSCNTTPSSSLAYQPPPLKQLRASYEPCTPGGDASSALGLALTHNTPSAELNGPSDTKQAKPSAAIGMPKGHARLSDSRCGRPGKERCNRMADRLHRP